MNSGSYESSDFTEAEWRFYRQLFLRRYALLLEKAEQSFSIPKDALVAIRRHILSLDWVDGGIQQIPRHIMRAPQSD